MELSNQTTEKRPGAHNSNGQRGNLFSIHVNQGHRHADSSRPVLTLNVLLLGDMQSGRSSVGNALIGGLEFQAGVSLWGVPVTTESRLLSRTFPDFFRRNRAESDLRLRIVDTPPLPCPSRLRQEVRETLGVEDVHVVVLVVPAPRCDDTVITQLTHIAQTVFGPLWSQHALLVLTHADKLREAGLQPPTYLSQASESLRLLIDRLGGGFMFLDNSSDWPVIVGKPLRDRLLDLSASNHHCPLKLKADI